MRPQDTDPVYQATQDLCAVVNRYSTGIAGQALTGVLLAVVKEHNGCDAVTAARMLVRTFESYAAPRKLSG
jgi:hypothetical protein